MYGLSFCSGVGLLDWGLQEAAEIEVVAYIEREPYPQAVLIKRMQEGYLSEAPIYDDLRTFDGRPYHELVDIMFGGIPCQPHSTAGKRRGAVDERNLWPDTRRIISEVGPRYVFLENVPGVVGNGYAGEILGGLATLGYDCLWTIVSAAQVGAPHKRERWFCLGVLADAELRGCVDGQPQRQPTEAGEPPQRDLGAGGSVGAVRRQARHEIVSDAYAGGWRAHFQDILRRKQNLIRAGLADAYSLWQPELQRGEPDKPGRPGNGCEEDVSDPVKPRRKARGGVRFERPSEERVNRGGGRWVQNPADEPEASESFVGRVVDGCPSRVDRLRCLGNAVVPQQAALAWRILTNQGGELTEP